MVKESNPTKGESLGSTMKHDTLENTGAAFSHEALMAARRNTTQAIALIAAAVKPGMLEEEARAMAKETLERLGSHKGWHKILIRFGPNTVKNFEDPSEPAVRLGANDLFFVDIGPIWAIPRVTEARPSSWVKIQIPICVSALKMPSGSSM
jgi:hypothetical protein